MTYTGHVDPGGPSATRELPSAIIRKLSVGPVDNNAYLITCSTTGAQALIDAPAEPDRLLFEAAPDREGPLLDLVVITHCHLDHIGALWDVVDATGAQVAVGADDADAVEQVTEVAVHRRVRNADHLRVGDLDLEVIGLQGHTPGSIALALRTGGRAHLFTGDSLFPGGPGNTDHDPGRFDQLFTHLTERVFDRFEDDTWVYPGHGDDTTLGAERPHLQQWRARGW